jgi:uncharacterized protein (TIGR00369 family)
MSAGFRELVGLEVGARAEGHAVVTLEAAEEHLNPHGSVHGGVVATLVDVAMGAAVVAAGGDSPVTIEMKVTYLDPAKPGHLRAEARVRKRGRRLTIVEAEVFQGQGDDLVALALATFTS